jgi:hypothetical protein
MIGAGHIWQIAWAWVDWIATDARHDRSPGADVSARLSPGQTGVRGSRLGFYETGCNAALS